MQNLKAIAAMSLNRVIGAGNRIPWHLPEDFKWFKQTTTGHLLVMGRRTFESIGKPLPNRTTLVLSRTQWTHPGVQTIQNLADLPERIAGRQTFICGGAQIYEQTLPFCSELYLTLVKRQVEGDAYFPPFEDRFELVTELHECLDFKILHYRNRAPHIWSSALQPQQFKNCVVATEAGTSYPH
ncbi:MAG: dihydrofolate reductase [Verrucomicrobiae bacterium]|nr:dihydrofolate reductase [Verrucomicrobiae bacterium]